MPQPSKGCIRNRRSTREARRSVVSGAGFGGGGICETKVVTHFDEFSTFWTVFPGFTTFECPFPSRGRVIRMYVPVGRGRQPCRGQGLQSPGNQQICVEHPTGGFAQNTSGDNALEVFRVLLPPVVGWRRDVQIP